MDYSLTADVSQRLNDSTTIAARFIVEAFDERIDGDFTELRRVKVIAERDCAQKFLLVRARLPAEALERFRNLPAHAPLRVFQATHQRFHRIEVADLPQRRDGRFAH